MKRLTFTLILSILLLSACQALIPDTSPSEADIDSMVSGTLTAIAEQEEITVISTIPPIPEDSVSPAWLSIPDRVTGIVLPAKLSGLVYRDDAVWLVDNNGLTFMAMGQPNNGILTPDGTGYLFSSQPPAGDDIMYFNLFSDEVTQWTDTPEIVEHSFQIWPERQDVLVYQFVPVEQLGPWSGYLAAKVISTGETIIIDEEEGSNTIFSLSPDGTTIAYLRGFAPALFTWGGESKVLDMKSFGLDYDRYSTPAWSPDGKLLALHASGGLQDAGTVSAVVVLDLAANSAVVVHEFLSFGQRAAPELAFSPDGKWLASVNPGEIGGDGSPITMWVFDLAGGNEPVNFGFATSPFWDPEGGRLVYTAWPGVGISDPHQIRIVETGVWLPEAIEPLTGAFVIDWLDLP